MLEHELVLRIAEHGLEQLQAFQINNELLGLFERVVRHGELVDRVLPRVFVCYVILQERIETRLGQLNQVLAKHLNVIQLFHIFVVTSLFSLFV